MPANSSLLRALLVFGVASCTLPDVSFDRQESDTPAGQGGGDQGQGGISQGGTGATEAGCSATTAYRNAVLEDAPIGYWRMGDSMPAQVQDSSGHGLHLDRHGQVTSGQTGALVCDADEAMRFAVDGYLSRDKTAALEPTNAITLEFWMQQTGTPTIFQKPLWYGDANGPPYGAWGIERWKEQPDRQFSFFVNLGGVPAHLHSTAFPDQNRWYYVVATYDGTVMRFYVDGQLDGESGPPAIPGGPIQYPDPYGFAIGACQGPYSLFSGMLDEVAVYDKALTADRVATHFSAAFR